MSSNIDRQLRLDEKDDDAKARVPFHTYDYDSDGDDDDEDLPARSHQQRMRGVTESKENEEGDDEDNRKPPAKPSQRAPDEKDKAVACPPVEDEKAHYRRQVDMANVILSQHAAMANPGNGMLKPPGAVAVGGQADSDAEDRVQSRTEELRVSEPSTRASIRFQGAKSVRSVNGGTPGAEYVPRIALGLTPDSAIVRNATSTRNISSSTNNRPLHVATNAWPVVSPQTQPQIELADAPNQGKWRKSVVLASVVGVLAVVVAVVLGVLLGTKSKNQTSSASSKQTTSPFTFDCSIIQAQPHVITQCHCNGTIFKLPEDTIVAYGKLRKNFIPTFDPNFNYAMDSCDPRNQALVWLAGDSNMAKSTTYDFKMYQRYNLALLFLLWNGPGWSDKKGWLSLDDECTWFGLSCDDVGKVVHLSLGQNNVLGNFAPVTLLTNLVSLTLKNNFINGSIPSQIGLLTNLQTLLLSFTSTSGTIPNELFGLGPSLKSVDVSGNRLTGIIPTLIGQLTRLDLWDVHSNNLIGTIPNGISSAKNLTLLDLFDNNLNGTIPTVLGLLTALQYFVMDRNEFSGTLPSQLGKCSQLVEFRVSYNHLHGAIPSELGNLTNLTIFDVESNQFTGSTPQEICRRFQTYRLNGSCYGCVCDVGGR